MEFDSNYSAPEKSIDNFFKRNSDWNSKSCIHVYLLKLYPMLKIYKTSINTIPCCMRNYIKLDKSVKYLTMKLLWAYRLIDWCLRSSAKYFMHIQNGSNKSILIDCEQGTGK